MAGKLRQYYKGPATKLVIRNNYKNKRISVKAYGKIKVRRASNEYRKPSNQALS